MHISKFPLRTPRRVRIWARIKLCFVLIAFSTASSAQTSQTSASQYAQASSGECIGLVLGGGGARGAAHVGVLRVLERERIPICRIVGTSMGAIVGALYATGYNADQIETILKTVDWKGALSDDTRREDQPMRRKIDSLRFGGDGNEIGLRDGQLQLPRGLLQGQRLELLLRRILLPAANVDSFDDLPIPFRAVATDLLDGKEVVIGRGNIASAIRASMSVPGVFQPIRRDGRLLVDGGIANNVPVSVARSIGATRLIVVDVGAPFLREEELSSPISVSLQVVTVLMQRVTDASLATLSEGDVLIRPQLGDIGSADFIRAIQSVPLGEAAAMEKIDNLRALSVDAETYAQFEKSHQMAPLIERKIDFVRVDDTRSVSAGLVRTRLGELEGQSFDLKELESAIAKIYADDRFERITWHPIEEDGRHGIEVLPVDKGWGPHYIRAGLALSDDFAGRSGYQLTTDITFTGMNAYGGEWRTRADLGNLSGLRTEFYQPVGERRDFFASVSAGFTARNQRVNFGQSLAEFRFERYLLGVEAGYNASDDLQIYGGLAAGRDVLDQAIGSFNLPVEIDSDFSRVYLGALYDDLDGAGFPSKGKRVSTRYSFYVPALGTIDAGQVAQFSYDHAIGRDRGTVLFGLRAQTAIVENTVLESFGSLGGLAFLSGYGERDLLGSDVALARAIYYRRMDDTSKLLSVPTYLGLSLEAGKAWTTRDDVSLDSLTYAASVFFGADTFLGPMFIGYGRNDENIGSFYLNFRPLVRTLDDSR